MRAQVISSAVLVAVIGCASGRDALERTAPPICEVSLYARGLSPGCVSFELGSRRMKAFQPGLTEKMGTWGYLESVVGEQDAGPLLKLVEAVGAKRFRPQARWFSKGRRNREGSVVMVLRWADGELAVAMPPPDVSSKVPATAARVYSRLDALGRVLLSMARNEADKKQSVEVSLHDARFARFEERRETVFREALPKDRDGW